jgi:hypothetical protein
VKLALPCRFPLHFLICPDKLNRWLKEPSASEAARCTASIFFCNESSMMAMYELDVVNDTGKIDLQIHWINRREDMFTRVA